MCTVIKICPKHWTWYNHWLLWNQTYSPTGWQWFLKLAGAHWVKSAAKSWLPVVFHVCVQILANYLLGCGKTWTRSPFPIRATLSHHFTTSWRIAGRAALLWAGGQGHAVGPSKRLMKAFFFFFLPELYCLRPGMSNSFYVEGHTQPILILSGPDKMNFLAV